MIPRSARFVVVGAGVHGLSVAVHLAERLGSGEEIVVLDKLRVGAGASGVSGGIVRNFYRSAAINEIVRRSVEIFELDPALFGFRQVGYLAVVPEAQAEDLERIAEQHAAVGYASRLVLGADAVTAALRVRFPDWRATGAAAMLDERRSGWADAGRTVAALAGIARSAGVRICERVEVTGFDRRGDDVESVETRVGPIACRDAVVLAPGPWARDLWNLLGLPEETEVTGKTRPIFHYWQVREGEAEHPTASLHASDPVVHVDADVALPGLDPPWGIYLRPGLGRAVAIGGLPLPLPTDCPLDPYGPSHPTAGRTSEAFGEAMTTALGWALERFAGATDSWSRAFAAAPTCFTPDSYPIVGPVAGNAYAILDSNHGFKMLALGMLAAGELASGEVAPELEPFRLDRFAAGALHPVSASPYPWT